jgi:hypothetical protein
VTFTAPILTIVAPQVFSDVAIGSTGITALACSDPTADADGNVFQLTTLTTGVSQLTPGLVYTVGYIEQDDGTAYHSSAKLADIVVNEANIAESFLLFETAIIQMPPATDAEEVFIVQFENNPATWEVQQIDLVLHKLLQPVKMDKFQYETLSVEMTNQPLSESYRKQFYLENDAYKFIYMTPLDTLISAQNEAGTYRLTLNNIDLTNRDIPITPDTNGSLYNDRLVMNIDGLASVQPHNGGITTVVYPDRCPYGSQNMLEVKIDAVQGEEMLGCLGHLFKSRLKSY